ncbi:hypothetical protein [Nonomuraea helvata]|uniref:Uncharacterized protein n=1 Tax=Nonomuraea helvata TaxID=37484 RepID=A0ABV5SDC3_9ACTN
MGRIADDLPLRLARGMLWATFGILFYIRAAGGLDNGAGVLGALLAMAPYPPLVTLVVWRRNTAVRYGLLAAVVPLYFVPFLVVGELWDVARARGGSHRGGCDGPAVCGGITRGMKPS